MMRLSNVLLILFLISTACVPLLDLESLQVEPRVESTFIKFHRLAKTGDAKSQNLIGFMMFFGEVAPDSRLAAQRWFRASAAQGNVSAQLNLAVMRYLGATDREDHEEAERYFRLAEKNNFKASSASTLEFNTIEEFVDQSCRRMERRKTSGERTYVTFCAGCHGMNGLAAYGGSPSFALGERMEKSDEELLRTIMSGHGIMPSWIDKFPRERLSQTLRFIRSLQPQFRNGILHVLRPTPSQYFTFGPMESDFSIDYTDGVLEYDDNIEFFIRLCRRARTTTSREGS